MKSKPFRTRSSMAGLAAVAGLVIANWPVTTRFGVNYVWSSQRIPLYEKVINFVSRDLQTRRLANEITAGGADDDEKLLKMFSWVTQHVKGTPEGFPVIDDHILHVIIRGYGGADQRTEVFAVLAGYAGFRTSVARLEPPGRTNIFMFVALVRSGTKTYVFDVVHELAFKNAQGRLADINELLSHPELVTAAAPGLVVRDIPYDQYLLGLRHPLAFSRTDAQKLWPRLKQELLRLFSVHVE